MPLRTSDFDFALPEELIAQSPAARRDESRLMVVNRASGEISHRRFCDLLELMPAGDLLVLNTTKVFRARLLGTRDSGAAAEVLLLAHLDGNRWEAMVKPGAKLQPGRLVHIAPGFDVTVLEATERGTRIVQLLTADDADRAIEQHGHIPLPPYIVRPDSDTDVERYQTVYARERGSVAAPTAGLHFTPELLGALAAKGVHRADICLHVGVGTFKPVEVEDLVQHVKHEESYQVTAEAAAAVNSTRARGNHVWAVGTTSLRTLETMTQPDGSLASGNGATRIFIHPPHPVRGADRLITNFHLPRSTLLMLVAAMAGIELTLEAYRTAVRERYRFYSYGDAMVIL